MSDGTGIVHIAPAFGEDDSKVGRKYDLPFVQFVNGKGEMTEETPYAGKFVKDADPDVLVDLDKAGDGRPVVRFFTKVLEILGWE
jgi:isoleucyl-tRNA synthetase